MWTKERFDEWHSSPLTQDFFKFLSDKREDLKETWATGAQLGEKDEAIAFVYGDILSLEYEHVAAFYDISTKLYNSTPN